MTSGNLKDPGENRSTPLSAYVDVAASPERMARVWRGVSEHLERTPPAASRARRWLIRTGAALSLATATATAAVMLYQPTAPPSALSGAALQTATDALTVDLEDGSKLELEAHTRVLVEESSERAVVIALGRGSIDCKVVPNRSRNFEVRASGVRVRVTGTRFSVEVTDDARVTIRVESGSVEVTPADGRQIKHLTAGESLSLDTTPVKADVTETVPTQAAAPEGRAPSTDARSNDEEREPRRELIREPAPPSAQASDSGEDKAPTPTVEMHASAKQLFDRGNAARRQGNSSTAARAYEKLLADYPEDPRAGLAAFELGRLRMDRLGNLQGAVVALRRAVALAPGAGFKEDAMARLVQAYAAMGAADSCRSAQKAYLDAFPSGVHASSVAQKCGTR